MKIKIGRYYENGYWNRVFKYIDKENDVYFFKLVDGRKYDEAKCTTYNKSSRLCKKCNEKRNCYTGLRSLADLKEIPYLKAVLLYGK